MDIRGTPKIDFSEDYDVAALNGRTAIVTGGATGIGKGCAIALAEAGAYVTIADVNEDEANSTVKELTAKGKHIQFVKTDVSQWSDLVAAFRAAVNFSPKNTIDIVMPCAGIARPSLWAWIGNTPMNTETNEPEAPSTKVLDVNLIGVYNTAFLAIWYFKNHPGDDLSYSKNIVFVSSMGGYSAMATVCDYNSSKWGVRGLFYSLRNLETFLGEDKPKFRVNLIAPTYVRTPMTMRGMANPNRNSTVKVAEVSDCVHVVLRMASDEKVIGRAAAIAAEKQSFDLGDDGPGLQAGLALSATSAYEAFGYPVPQKETNGTKAE